MFKNKYNQVRAGWLIFGALLIVLTGQIMFTLPGETMISLLEMSSRHDTGGLSSVFDPYIILLTQGAGTFGAIAATLIAFRTINKKNPNKLGVQGPPLDFLVGLALGALSMTIIFVFLYATGQISLENSLGNPRITAYFFIYAILFILVGFFEEMFFRGYVIKTLQSRRHSKLSVYLISAGFFSVAHMINPNVALLGLVNIFFIGLLFAYMFDVTKSLLLPIGYHITWNFFQGTVFGFPVSGTEAHGLYEIDVTNGITLLTGGSFGVEASLITTLIIGFGFIVTKFYTRNRIEVGKW